MLVNSRELATLYFFVLKVHSVLLYGLDLRLYSQTPGNWQKQLSLYKCEVVCNSTRNKYVRILYKK